MKKYYYLYKIINKINGNIYVGVHETYDVEDNYLGSGKIISRSIKKYGKENFEKHILEFFDNQFDMYLRESEIVNEEFLMDPKVINIALGGTGGSMYTNQQPFMGPHTEESKLKIGNAAKGRFFSEEARKKMSDNNFSKKDPTRQREHASKIGKMRWIKNKENGVLCNHSEETKQKISNSLLKRNLEMSDEEKQRRREKMLNRKKREKTRWIYSLILKKSKMISLYEELPAGWIEGRKITF